MIKVNMPINGAAMENTIRCLRTRCLSKPSCIKNETRPNAAGPFSKFNNSLSKFNLSVSRGLSAAILSAISGTLPALLCNSR